MTENIGKEKIKTSTKARNYCTTFLGISFFFFIIDFIFISFNFGKTEANTVNALISTVITVLLVGLFDFIDYFNEDKNKDTEKQNEDQRLKTLCKGMMMIIGSMLPIVYGVLSLGRIWGIVINILIAIITLYGIYNLRKL
ncbi:hypothetical protein ACRS8V_07400 [Staphylococcus epidermidis]